MWPLSPANVAVIQGDMTKRGYPNTQEPNACGSVESVAEALGTVRPTGRTRSTEPSRSTASTLQGDDASTDHFRLTYFDPPAGLERHVLALFHFEWDEANIEDRHPGALGQLFMTPLGSGEIRFGDRVERVEGDAHMFGGFETAAPFRFRGPWHSYGVSLSPIGWAALAQSPASDCLNHFFPASHFLGPDIDGFAGDLNRQYRDGAITGEQACEQLGRWIAPRLASIPDSHEEVIERALGWLGSSLHPDVDQLYSELDYSRRQVERLVRRYFGFTPAALARKMRAIRAANLLSQPNLTDEGEAEIANAFYDQPHMIREIRRYCGYTPARLGGGKEPLFQTMLRMRNLDRLRRFRAIGGHDSA